MTLGKGNKLIKVTTNQDMKGHDGTTFADRVRGWLANHQDSDIPTDQELAHILCPWESYVVHEVESDVHYTADSTALGVDLKVLY